MQVQQRLHMAKTSWRELGTFMELYRRECCKGNYMDFDSLLSILVAVMQHVPDVLDKYCNMFMYDGVFVCDGGGVWACMLGRCSCDDARVQQQQ